MASKSSMMLVSNFDNKDVRDLGRSSNTAIFQYPVSDTVESRYVVTDWVDPWQVGWRLQP